jgi:hypothetical protein
MSPQWASVSDTVREIEYPILQISLTHPNRVQDNWSYFVSGSAAASGTQTNEIEGSWPCCLLLGMKAVSPHVE